MPEQDDIRTCATDQRYQPSTFRCAVCSRFVPLRKVWSVGEGYAVEPHGSCAATTRAIPVVDLDKAMHDRSPGSARRVVAWLIQTHT